MLLRFVCLLSLLCSAAIFAEEKSNGAATEYSPASGIAPDLRDDDTALKLQKGDFVVVPVPIVSPTFGSGLIAGGAYFYRQTEAQEKVQPASITAVGGMYTNNNSKLIAIGHQSYWDSDSWRLGGGVGLADLKLSLLTPENPETGRSVNWNIRGNLAFAQLSRKVHGRWYVGISARIVDFEQSFSSPASPDLFGESIQTKTVGFGVSAEHDSRDMPMNSYSGHLFQFSALFNDEAFGSDDSYQSYKVAYRSYHELSLPIVVAWEVQGCKRADATPLWDSCKINLRGFAATDYLSETSASGQVEARWRMSKRWGLVGFAGGGYSVESFSDIRERELIPSYGVGLRFMVLQAKRINLRVDYARSTGSSAVHVSVGEAF